MSYNSNVQDGGAVTRAQAALDRLVEEQSRNQTQETETPREVEEVEKEQVKMGETVYGPDKSEQCYFHPTTKTGKINLGAFWCALQEPLTRKLEERIDELKSIKTWVDICVEYEKVENARAELQNGDGMGFRVSAHLRTRGKVLLQKEDVPRALSAWEEEIESRNLNFNMKSGLRMKEIKSAELKTTHYNPLAASKYIDLPPRIKYTNAVINIQNDDNRCFAYSILAAVDRPKNNYWHKFSYTAKFNSHPILSSLQYPISPTQLPELEKKLQYRLNAFTFEDDQGLLLRPLHAACGDASWREIDLLYVPPTNTNLEGHWCCITDFNKFMHTITKNEKRKFFCKKCFMHFTKTQVLETHQKYCNYIDNTT